MPEPSVVPFLPKSALFVRGMKAKCPALDAVVTYAAKEEAVPPLRRDVILERLFRSLPALPAAPDAEITDALSALGPERIDALAGRQRGGGAERLRAVMDPVASALDVEAERAFARRCGTLIIELFRRRSCESGLRPAVSLKNA